ncbi:MAG: response regulator [Deltaproteobacteria bacterium]|nr:response regulator [Deltaproteobacteria bacterium]
MGKAILFPGGSPKGGGFPSGVVPTSAVPRIARICALGLAFDELLDEVCREILALSGADGGCLFLSTRDARSETFSSVAESGTLPDVSGAYRPGPALERLLDRMRTEGRIQADDLSLLPASDPLKRILDPFPVRSALLIPLRFGTRLLGFVALHVTGEPKPWGSEVLSAMDMVSAILSAALERRRAEDRLRASEARYRFLTDHSPDLITLHDATGRILYASPASLPMLGVRPELMNGSPIEGFLHPDDAGNVVAEIGRTAGGEKPDTSLPYRMRCADGRFVDVETSATPFPEGPEGDRRVLRVTRDISGRRKLEARIAEGQTLSTIGMLAGGVAHEFNNVLAAIQGSVELLSMHAGGNPQARPYIDVIRRMANRATELTRQLLAYSRQGKYTPTSIPLARVLSETLPTIRTSLPSGVEFSSECDDALPFVYVDIAQMKQVVMGLCLNAAEAMAGGGRLSVRTYSEPGDGRVVLEVSDTGPGIDAKTMPRIFEPFFTTKSVGRGMGLAAIRGIVDNHGGEIRIVSREGKGTTCTVLLPVSEVPAAPEPPSAEGQSAGAGRVLLVDDEEEVRGVVHAMLDTLGYEVIEARDGLEALEIFRCRAAEIDLVILDLVMPHMTGEATLERIRRIAPAVPAILISGYDESGRIREIVDAGFGGFLQKPFRRQDLGKKVRELLGVSDVSSTE